MNLNINEIVKDKKKDEDGFLIDLGDEMKYYIMKSWLMDRVLHLFLLDPKRHAIDTTDLHIKNERNKKIFAYLLKQISSSHINTAKHHDAFTKYINR
jgi:hypothetical protein